MNAIRFPALSPARWDWVIEHGTRFFGRTDLCQHWEARQQAWGWIHAAGTPAWTCGADVDFLTACALYVAELAEAYDKEPGKDVFRHSKTLPRVQIGKRGRALTTIRKIHCQLPTASYSKTKKLEAQWKEAKGQVTQDQGAQETNVDEAFTVFGNNPCPATRDALMVHLDAYLCMESSPLSSQSKPRWRPPSPCDLKETIVGMDKHLYEVTGRRQRGLLSQFLGYAPDRTECGGVKIYPSQLRSLINDYKKRLSTTGRMELQLLMKQWEILKNEMLAQ